MAYPILCRRHQGKHKAYERLHVPFVGVLTYFCSWYFCSTMVGNLGWIWGTIAALLFSNVEFDTRQVPGRLTIL